MKRYLSIVVALLCFNCAQAQTADSHKEFDEYAKIYKEGSGYELKAPKGYVDAGHEAFFWSPQSHIRAVGMKVFRMRLYSKKKDAMIVYPVEAYFALDKDGIGGIDEPNGVIEYVMSVNQYDWKYTSTPDPMTQKQKFILPKDVDKYYKMYDDKRLKKWFNADRIYVTHFKLLKPFDEYTHAMAISFHGYQKYEVVCFIKDDSKKLRESVFEDLKGNIMLNDSDEYTFKSVGKSQIKIVEKFGTECSKKYMYPTQSYSWEKNKMPGRI